LTRELIESLSDETGKILQFFLGNRKQKNQFIYIYFKEHRVGRVGSALILVEMGYNTYCKNFKESVSKILLFKIDSCKKVESWRSLPGYMAKRWPVSKNYVTFCNFSSIFYHCPKKLL